MSSNDERAQSGDTIEITTHLRNDLGTRMQVATSDGLSIVAMDNRMRVTVAHGDYKIVKRCGRPATADAPAKKRGRPSNAEIAARAAANLPCPVCSGIEGCDHTFLERQHAADKAKCEPFVVTDADVAGLEAAIEIDVPVTRKAALTVDESKVTVQSSDVSVEAAAALGVEMIAAPGDLIELRHLVIGYPAGAWLEVIRRVGTDCVEATGPHSTDRVTVLNDAEYRIVRRKLDMAKTMQMATEFARLPADVRSEHAKRIMAEAGMSDHHLDSLKYIKPLTISQERLDAMTTHTEPRGFVQAERKHSHYFKPCPFDEIDVYRVLERFNVTDQAIGHALKKLLVAGGRGHKDIGKDVQEAIDTLERWQDMRDEERSAA